MTTSVNNHEFVRTGPSGKVRFMARPSQKGVHDDSVVKTWYWEESDGTQQKAYGIIQNMFTHALYPGGPCDVVIECEWLELLGEDERAADGHLPQVRHNPASNFNLRARYTFLRQCTNYNIVLLPHDPWDEQCSVYDVVDRWRTYEDHSNHQQI